jgi:hypothetical protein
MRRITENTKWGTDDYLLLDGDLAEYSAKYASTIRSKMGGYGGDRWYGNSYSEFEKKVTIGDESLVSESEAFLARIEDQVPMSRGYRNFDDVVGAIPNVPAYLAGHPQCMRRRQRVMRETAPLAIYMDLTSSGGISAADVQKRGIVLLALTRLLVEHRPVELWVGTSLGGGKVGAGTVAWRIDTAPLDLARAAFHISATVMSRGFGYALCQDVLKTGGSWPFYSYDTHCQTAKERLVNVFPGQETLYIPPIMYGDAMTQDPVGWIKRTMASYVAQED